METVAQNNWKGSALEWERLFREKPALAVGLLFTLLYLPGCAPLEADPFTLTNPTTTPNPPWLPSGPSIVESASDAVTDPIGPSAEATLIGLAAAGILTAGTAAARLNARRNRHQRRRRHR